MNNHLLSIIIPVYNAEHSIGKTLDSILAANQEYIDIVIINDGSTDASENKCQQYASKFNNITLVSQTNQGVSSARNLGIEKAKGDYIWFVDADDEINPEIISTFLNILRTEPDLLWFETLHNNGSDYSSDLTPKNFDESTDIRQFRKLFGYKGGMLWQFILKKQIITDNDLNFKLYARWCQDEDFLMYYQQFVKNVYIYSQNWGYRYMLNRAGATRKANADKRLECVAQLSLDAIAYPWCDPECRDFVLMRKIIALTYSLRKTSAETANHIYCACKEKGIFPLPLYGNLKDIAKIIALNCNLRVFRLFFK